MDTSINLILLKKCPNYVIEHIISEFQRIHKDCNLKFINFAQ